MKLTDEKGQEYEFELDGILPQVGQRGTLKPVDSWPKEDDGYWFVVIDSCGIRTSHNVWYADHTDKEYKENNVLYRTKQEAEYAAERIRSLQEARMRDVEVGWNDDADIAVDFFIPKKYLKAWEELSNEPK